MATLAHIEIDSLPALALVDALIIGKYLKLYGRSIAGQNS